MRILYFSPRACWPVTSGGRLRDYHLARQLGLRAEVTYLGFSSDPGQKKVVRKETGAYSEIDQILVPREAGYAAGKILRGMAGPVPLPILNYTTRLMKEELTRTLEWASCDSVQMEGVHLHSYLPIIRAARSRPRLICDWHNIESELMSRFGENAATPMHERWYANRTVQLLRNLENDLLDACDGHLVCSERERSILLSRRREAVIQVAANGVDVGFHAAPDAPEKNSRPRDLVFAGSMDYHANIDAALYFAHEIWPLVRAEMPELRFVVVGSKPVPAVVALAREPGILVTGTVADVRPYYRNAAAVVVPLRVGSGTRLKVLEAMAAGIPVVSTQLGIEGIDAADGADVIVADGFREFAGAVLKLVRDAPLRLRLSKAGLELVRSTYDWNIIGKHVYDFHAQVLPSPADRL